LAFLPFTDDATEVLFGDIPSSQRFRSWHLVDSDGTRTSSGDATLALMDILPATQRTARIIRHLRLAWVVRLAYRLVARMRRALSRWVKDTPPLRRFP